MLTTDGVLGRFGFCLSYGGLCFSGDYRLMIGTVAKQFGEATHLNTQVVFCL